MLTGLAALAALAFIQLTGPDHQIIQLNPKSIIDYRPPRGTDHFAPGTKCLIHASDGKFIPVTETCDEIRHLLEDMKQ
jgi:hypothetical protein